MSNSSLSLPQQPDKIFPVSPRTSSAATTVRVAVRVRPFNDREKDLNAICCVEMDGPCTVIRDLESRKDATSLSALMGTAGVGNASTNIEKRFTFDYSFWSHDGFVISPDGRSIPDSQSSKYADQRKVV
jgi:hypothetical protein